MTRLVFWPPQTSASPASESSLPNLNLLRTFYCRLVRLPLQSRLCITFGEKPGLLKAARIKKRTNDETDYDLHGGTQSRFSARLRVNVARLRPGDFHPGDLQRDVLCPEEQPGTPAPVRGRFG